MGLPDVATEAVRLFLAAHTCCRSSLALSGCMSALAACDSADELFFTPLREKMLDLRGGLLWMTFVEVTLRALCERQGQPLAGLDLGAALRTLLEVFDLEADEALWRHAAEASGETDSDDDTDDTDTDDDDGSSGADAASA